MSISEQRPRLISSCAMEIGEKEKPYVFRTRIVIFQPSVILFPVRNSKLDKISAGQLTVGDVMFSLEIVEYCQCLMLETDTKPFGEIRKCADPFSGTD